MATETLTNEGLALLLDRYALKTIDVAIYNSGGTQVDTTKSATTGSVQIGDGSATPTRYVNITGDVEFTVPAGNTITKASIVGIGGVTSNTVLEVTGFSYDYTSNSGTLTITDLIIGANN